MVTLIANSYMWPIQDTHQIVKHSPICVLYATLGRVIYNHHCLFHYLLYSLMQLVLQLPQSIPLRPESTTSSSGFWIYKTVEPASVIDKLIFKLLCSHRQENQAQREKEKEEEEIRHVWPFYVLLLNPRPNERNHPKQAISAISIQQFSTNN